MKYQRRPDDRHRTSTSERPRSQSPGPSPSALRTMMIVHQELNQIAEAASLLMKRLGFQQKLLLQRGAFQVTGQGMDQNLVADVFAEPGLPRRGILTGMQVLFQHTHEPLTHARVQRSFLPPHLQRNRRLTIGFVEGFGPDLESFQALQENVGSSVWQWLHADQPANASHSKHGRIAVIV